MRPPAVPVAADPREPKRAPTVDLEKTDVIIRPPGLGRSPSRRASVDDDLANANETTARFDRPKMSATPARVQPASPEPAPEPVEPVEPVARAEPAQPDEPPVVLTKDRDVRRPDTQRTGADFFAFDPIPDR
ncbi:MAG: hypothetical protein ACQSGP_00790, partial [Frankia sp.]